LKNLPGGNKGFPTNSRDRESLFLQLVSDLYGLDIIWKHSKNTRKLWKQKLRKKFVYSPKYTYKRWRIQSGKRIPRGD
jgi:hypothetical protein